MESRDVVLSPLVLTSLPTPGCDATRRRFLSKLIARTTDQFHAKRRMPGARPMAAARGSTIMPQAYLIEVAGIDAGLAYRERNGFRFIASARRFAALDGERYASPAHAERAAQALLRRTEARRPPHRLVALLAAGS